MIPTVDGDRKMYASRSRQLLLSGSLIGLFLASLSLLFERDPGTGLKPLPSDYVWVVVPLGMLIVVLAWRALKAKLVTNSSGLDVVRVVGQEFVPWRVLRRFEVHPTPGRQGFAVVARLHDERLVKVWTEIMVKPLRDRPAAKARARVRATALVDQLETDRIQRAGAISQAPGQPARG